MKDFSHSIICLLIRQAEEEGEGKKMQKRRLGRTNLNVSVVGFGGIPIIGASVKDAVKMIRRAFDLGINYFDTARTYGDSEEKFGIALKDVRDKCVIATKTHQRTKEEAARIGLKQSLRNLRTDRIDLVQLHGIDDEKTLEKAISPEGSLAALKEARSQGKIDFIGISGHSPYVLAKAIRTGEFDTVLVPLNLLFIEATEELIPLAKELDVGVIVMKPFGGTELEFAQRQLHEGLQKTMVRKEFDRIFGTSIDKTRRSLRFVLAHDIATTIPGFNSLEEVESAVRVATEFKGLTKQEKEVFKFGELPPEPFCRECGLCVPCPDGLNTPRLLSLDKYFTHYGIKTWTRQAYQKASTKIDCCTECKECEAKCPYNLPIVNMLHEAEKRFLQKEN
jgi:predicted aldo/keto reductase-like oxidoreductase